MSRQTRLTAVAAGCAIAAPILYFLFFFGLTQVGLLGPDEPRYAAIGREMARSGDWITPRLWGQPWFEKPPLAYWMTALGNLAGLGPELAPRLPVALVSVAFLGFFYALLAGQFGRRPAMFSTLILGTSAGWLAFCHVAVTDLPMTVTFAAAMLIGLRWLGGDSRWLPAAGVLLGLAVLAKGLVPLALAAPLFVMGRRRWREWIAPAAAFLATVTPWYALAAARHGGVFLNEFFWKHHFERFSSGALMHQQPFWYYAPVLLAGLFPWTPLAALLGRRALFEDRRVIFLAAWAATGFVFFSLAANKLPGYLLPLLPGVAALLGLALDQARRATGALAAAAALLGLLPIIAELLPRSLERGLSRAGPLHWPWAALAAAAAVAALVGWQERAGRREWAVGLTVLALALGVVWVKVNTWPVLDRRVSARSVWRAVEGRASETCVESMHRSWRYGLNYYSDVPLPDCEARPRSLRIRYEPGAAPQ